MIKMLKLNFIKLLIKIIQWVAVRIMINKIYNYKIKIDKVINFNLNLKI